MVFPGKELSYFIAVVFSIQQSLVSENISFERKFIGVKKGSTPKYWMKYAMKSMVSIFEKRWCYRKTCQLLTAAEYFSIKSYIFRSRFSKVEHPNFRCMGWKKPPIEELAPSIGYKFYWSNLEKCDLFASKFHLTFVLNGKLRMNITFIKLQLREFLGRCQKDKLIVESLGLGFRDIFTFCGIHSPFDLYPSFNNVSFSVELYKLIPVNLFVLFRVISDQLIKSHTTIKMYVDDGSTIEISLYSFPATKMVNYTYRIYLKKYLGISLTLEPGDDSYITLYVGPGVLSNKMEIGSDNRDLNLNTFQSVLQIMNKNQTYPYKNVPNIVYNSFNLSRTLVNLSNNYDKLISYPKGKCKNTNSPCILHIKCSANMYVNITISSAVHKGQSDSLCRFGGIAFYDFKFGIFLESLLLCNKFNYFQLVQVFCQQSMVFSSSSMILILYSYNEYSKLKFIGSASVSLCRGIQINICSNYYLCKMVDMYSKFKPQYRIFKDGLFEISQKSFYYHLMKKRNRSFNKKIYYINLLDNACIVMHISPNLYWVADEAIHVVSNLDAEREFVINHCSFQFTVGKTPSRSHLWKFVLSAFLEQNSLLMSTIFTIGYPHCTGKKAILEWDEVSKVKKGKLQCFNIESKIPQCRVTSEKNVQFFTEYYIKTPSHERTMRFKLDFYKWSYSWASFVIHPSNMTLENNAKEFPEINLNQYYYVKRIVMKKEAAFGMHILGNHTMNVEIQVQSFLFPEANMNWSNIYKIEQNQSQTIMIGLPGVVKYLTLRLVQGNQSVIAKICYYWIFVKSHMNYHLDQFHNHTFKDSVFENTKYLKIKSRQGTYHFIKFYKKSCFDLENDDSYCHSKVFSWIAAFTLCKDIGGSLPEFYSRAWQEEFVTILKTSTNIYLIEGIFINLKTYRKIGYVFNFCMSSSSQIITIFL